MRYFIDKKEVSEETYRKELRNKLYLEVYRNPRDYMTKEAYRIFNNDFDHLHRELGLNLIAKSMMNNHINLREVEVGNCRFYKEED